MSITATIREKLGMSINKKEFSELKSKIEMLISANSDLAAKLPKWEAAKTLLAEYKTLGGSRDFKYDLDLDTFKYVNRRGRKATADTAKIRERILKLKASSYEKCAKKGTCKPKSKSKSGK